MTATWAPTLTDVGDCIPSKTINVNLPGNDDYLGTFTSDTRPTAVQAQRTIDKCTDDITAAFGTIPASIELVARNAAMWRAAADIWLAYPDRDADITSEYAALDARAKYEYTQLTIAAASQGTGSEARSPYWSAPDPVWYGDRNDI